MFTSKLSTAVIGRFQCKLEQNVCNGSQPKFASNIMQITTNCLTSIFPEILRKKYDFLIIPGKIEATYFT